jgi:hypothetical protein
MMYKYEERLHLWHSTTNYVQQQHTVANAFFHLMEKGTRIWGTVGRTTFWVSQWRAL